MCTLDPILRHAEKLDNRSSVEEMPLQAQQTRKLIALTFMPLDASVVLITLTSQSEAWIPGQSLWLCA